MRVDDSRAFLANYGKWLKEYNALLKDAHSPMLQPTEIEDVQIDGAPALKLPFTLRNCPRASQWDNSTPA